MTDYAQKSPQTQPSLHLTRHNLIALKFGTSMDNRACFDLFHKQVKQVVDRKSAMPWYHLAHLAMFGWLSSF